MGCGGGGIGILRIAERGVEHRFVEIVQELVVLVVFGPAEGSLATDER